MNISIVAGCTFLPTQNVKTGDSLVERYNYKIETLSKARYLSVLKIGTIFAHIKITIGGDNFESI